MTLDPVLVLSEKGQLLRTWGAETVGVDTAVTPNTYGAHGIAVEQNEATGGVRVWIDDFQNHTLTGYDPSGKLLVRAGENGEAGNTTKPLLFGNVADTTFANDRGQTYVYSSDGDGGTSNRVVAMAVPIDPAHATEWQLLWATPAIFNNPHSLALHRPSNRLVVADREDLKLRLLDAATGADLGELDTGLHFGNGQDGRPFGVRTLHRQCTGGEWDLLYLALMDNPQDGAVQKIVILNATEIGQNKATVVQQLVISSSYSGPHLMDVDTATGNLYAALVSDKPKGTVLRFTPHKPCK